MYSLALLHDVAQDLHNGHEFRTPFNAYVPASEVSQDVFPDVSEYFPGSHVRHASPFDDDVVGKKK